MSTKCFTCLYIDRYLYIDRSLMQILSSGKDCARKSYTLSVYQWPKQCLMRCSAVRTSWFCHECNDGTKKIGASIDNMKSAVESLTQSLSGDLLNGLKMLTDTLASSLTSIHRSSNVFGGDTGSWTKRQRIEVTGELESENESMVS